MPNPALNSFDVGGPYDVGGGFYAFDIILSTDFEGTLNGVAYAGTDDSVQSFGPVDAGKLGPVSLVITAGSARLAGVNAP